LSRLELDPEAPTARRLSDQIATHLRARISRGDFQPGDRLIEAELSAEMRVSRAPLREALVTLQSDGLVELIPYRGAVVANLQNHDTQEIQALRAALEAVAARRAAELAPRSTAEALRERLRTMSEAATEGDVAAAALAHIDFHRAIAEASGYQRLVAFLDQLAGQSLALYSYAALPPSDLMTLAHDHVAIIEAIESGDSDRAQSAVVHNILEPSRPVSEVLAHRGYKNWQSQGRAK
jgi:DNA-binding GntR family transcriptional regulator